MASLKEVKTRIQSVISTQQITKAMKMVAAAKLRKAQDRILQMRPYAQKLNEILVNVASSLEGPDGSDFSTPREENAVLIVVITSDRGLCGAFNSNVLKKAQSRINDLYKSQYESGDLTILPIGKKALDFFRKRNYKIISDFSNAFSDLSFDNIRKIGEFIMKDYKEGTFDKVDLVYNEFKNVATQILRVEQYLPVVKPETTEQRNEYIFEPNVDLIVEELIPKSLKIQLYKAILESNAAEQGARMTAMGQATENAGELLEDLKLTYNRTRQAVITKEISEIVGGAEALG